MKKAFETVDKKIFAHFWGEATNGETDPFERTAHEIAMERDDDVRCYVCSTSQAELSHIFPFKQLSKGTRWPVAYWLTICIMVGSKNAGDIWGQYGVYYWPDNVVRTDIKLHGLLDLGLVDTAPTGPETILDDGLFTIVYRQRFLDQDFDEIRSYCCRDPHHQCGNAWDLKDPTPLEYTRLIPTETRYQKTCSPIDPLP